MVVVLLFWVDLLPFDYNSSSNLPYQPQLFAWLQVGHLYAIPVHGSMLKCTLFLLHCGQDMYLASLSWMVAAALFAKASLKLGSIMTSLMDALPLE